MRTSTTQILKLHPRAAHSHSCHCCQDLADGAGGGGGLHECKRTLVGKLGLGRLVCLLLLFLLALLIKSPNLWKTSSMIHVNTKDK